MKSACSSAVSGSTRATGSRCARPTPATSSGVWQKRAQTKRAARSTRQSGRCRTRCPHTSVQRSSFASRQRLGRRHEEVARVISDEAGKPLKAARVEAARAMSTYTFAAVEARKLAGEMVPMDAAQAGEGKLAFTLRRPIGIVGAISPFNFPLNLVAHKIAPALAAGCAVVLKPASQTPMSALLLAELEEEAGLPPGWLNVLVGPAVRDRRRSGRGRTREADHLHRLERSRLEAEGARAEEARQPRARQRDAGDRHGRCRRDNGRHEGLTERVRIRGPELHLGAACLCRTGRVRRVRADAHPARRTR